MVEDLRMVRVEQPRRCEHFLGRCLVQSEAQLVQIPPKPRYRCAFLQVKMSVFKDREIPTISTMSESHWGHVRPCASRYHSFSHEWQNTISLWPLACSSMSNSDL